MNKCILLCITVSLLLLNYPCNAQIGKIKDLKKKAEKTTKQAGKNIPDNQTSSDEHPTSSKSTSAVKVEEDIDYKNYVKNKQYAIQALNVDDINRVLTGENFHQKAIELDYPATYKTISGKGKQNADEYDYNKVMQFKEELPVLIQDILKPKINRDIEDAYSYKANIPKAMVYLNDALHYTEGILTIDPSNEEGKKLKGEVEQAKETIGSEYFKKVYTSDFHKQNIGKILFSNQPVKIGQENPEQFKTRFSGSENIYGMAYLDGIIEDIGDMNTSYVVTIDDGAGFFIIRFKHSDDELKNSWVPVEIIPEPSRATLTNTPVQWINELSGLSPRNHTLKIAYSSDELATAVIEIDLSAADMTKLKENASLAVNNATDNKARMAELPKQFSYTSGTYYDPGLSAAKIIALLMSRWENCSSITKLIIEKHSEGDEYMVYEDYGVPSYKSTRTAAHVIYTGKDGWCYYVTDIHFRRDYSGEGKYLAPVVDFERGHVKIDCKKLK